MEVTMPSRQEAIYRTMHNASLNYRMVNQGIRRLRYWLDQLKEPPASILEVGCGNGKLCSVLDGMGYDVVGLDIVPGPYDRDREEYRFVKHDLTRGHLPFKDDEFDYCISFDVIEHLSNKWANEVVWNMERISTDGIIGTVACFKSSVLHLTIEEPKWWMEVISRCTQREMQYQVFDSAIGKTLLFKPKKKEN